MHCDCASSLIEALTGSTVEDAPDASEAAAAPRGRCLWCGEPAEVPATESVSGR